MLASVAGARLDREGRRAAEDHVTRSWIDTTRTAIAGLLLGSLVAAQDGFEISTEDLARWGDEAIAALREDQGVTLEGVRVVLAGPGDVRAALERENRAFLVGWLGEEQGEAQAREFARSLARITMAKFAFGEKVAYVQPDVVETVSEATAMPELRSAPVVRALLLHELAHAADDERFGLQGLVDRCRSADDVQVLNHLLEGHAQVVTRRLAPRLGWQDGFAIFERALTAIPKDLPEDPAEGGERHLARISGLAFGQLYTEGERFVAALIEDGGRAAIAKAFANPPVDMEVIANPRWFLHPEERPAKRFDLDVLLDIAARNVDEEEEEWVVQRVSVPRATLVTVLAPLTTEEAGALVADLRQNRVLVCHSKVAPGRQVAIAALEFATPEAAEAYVRGMRTMQERRDEQWTSGQIRIERSDYQQLEPPAPGGFTAEKRVLVGGLSQDLCIAYASSGVLAFELMVVSDPDQDVADLAELVVGMLAVQDEARLDR